jgi:AhpD family alkylhydroperoxidase
VEEFNRRRYQNLSAFIADLKAIMAQRDQMKPLMRGEIIEGAFRERLMLAVTAVNRCRYCSYAHAKQALVEGMEEDEIHALQDGVLEDCPAEELPGLFYAQYWVETQGKPELEVQKRLIEEYDAATVQAIELTLRTIQMGNLLGNTVDYILYRLSFGRLGVQ